MRRFLGNRIELLQRAAMCPDLNPIEHVWDMMGRRLKALSKQPVNIDEFKFVARHKRAYISQKPICDEEYALLIHKMWN